MWSIIYYEFNSDGFPVNISSSIPFFTSPSNAAVCSDAASGSSYWDIYVTGNIISSNAAYYLRNNRNGSFALVSAANLIGNIPLRSASCAFASGLGGGNATLWKDIFTVGQDISTDFTVYLKNNRNGTFVNMVNTPSAFPGGAPTGCATGSVVVADFDGDNDDDLFYNGIRSSSINLISRLYFRSSNGSIILSTSFNMTGMSSQLYSSSSLAVDIDSDGDLDLIAAGQNAASQIFLSALLNNGLGNFTDGTSQIFGQLSGFFEGAMGVGQFTNDSMPDLIHIGTGSFCGPRVLLQRLNSPTNSSSSTSSDPSSGSTSSSSSQNLAALIGGLVGGVGFLLLLVACCILFTLCCCCMVCLLVVLILIAGVILVAVIAFGLFAAGDAGAVVLLVRRRGNKQNNEDMGMESVNASVLITEAKNTSDYRTIPWHEIHTVRKLGAGAFGEVMLAEWNGVEVAVKMFRNPTKEAVDEFKHEALMMAKVSHHPNVVNFIGASFPPDGMAIVLGLCAGGSLLSALEKKRLDAAKKTRVLGEVASALSFLHSLGIVHRDLAARNVLLDGSGKAKLADLGLSRLLEEKQGEQTTKSAVGPVRWMAPEAISARSYSSASDAYSFGALMAEVWSDGAPPHGAFQSVTDVAIAVLRHGARPSVAPSTPPAQAELMRQLFSTEPSQRPSMETARRVFQTLGEFDDGDMDAEAADNGEYVSAANLNQ